MDIKNILDKWHYDPYGFSVRLVEGTDGKEKIQIRLDLGLLQLELEGRPDGTKPHNKESLLDYYLEKIENADNKGVEESDMELSIEECELLRHEAIQYYHRYISLLELEKYHGVIKDTEHNIGILDLMSSYAEDKSDFMSYEQFRPYIIMINTLARGRLALEKDKDDVVMKIVDKGIGMINEARETLDLQDSLYGFREIKFLEEWKTDISSDHPPSDLEKLENKLARAVRGEKYESAALLRDEIHLMKKIKK
ncbi:MAG: UvrB/UvrC motif-containing protein [Candidatus Marinimicrobia bacterium]|nr:UvrB/UvrC motif-containing protein [Candidatus Neomarinimicrobiota bacterium]